MTRIAATAFLLAFCVVGAAKAQSDAPLSDRDVQAFYCSAVVPYFDDIIKSIPRPNETDIVANPELSEVARKIDLAKSKSDGDRQRLAIYVALRMAEMSTTTEIAQAASAISSGESDVSWMKSEMARLPCGRTMSPQTQQCADEELRLSGVGDRIARCRDLSWLP